MRPVSRLFHPVIALGLMAMTGLAAYGLLRLDAKPWLLPPDWGGEAGALPVGKEADAAVVLDPLAIRAAAATGLYSKRDSSAAWWGWLTQSIGPGRVLTPDQLTRDRLEPLRLLVVTRSAMPSVTSTVRPLLEDLVNRGGAVVLETPGEAWTAWTGVKLEGQVHPSGRITGAIRPFPDGLEPLLAGLSLPTRHQRATASPDTTPLLWIDGQPVAFQRQVGAGVVVTLAFDLGHVLQTVQQGLPDEDLRVRNRHPDLLSWPLETSDMVASRALLTASVPVADWLEDTLFQSVASSVALPAWWWYPEEAGGAFLMSHDEEGFGGRAAWMAEAGAGWQCPTTNFIVPSPAITQEDLERYQRIDAEIALHYVLPGTQGEDYPGSGFDEEGRFQSFGLWKVRPVRRLFSPLEQRRWLAERSPGRTPASASRTHFLAWTDGYTDLFHALASADIAIDSSYGPDLKSRGYLFGTARPFRPLGREGLPLPLYELPFITAEDLGGADESFLLELLAASAQTTHQAISVLYHPNAFSWHPSVNNYLTWKGLCQKARTLDHRPSTFSKLARFWNDREGSTLRSYVNGDRIRIEYRGAPEGATLAVPVDWRGRSVDRLEGARPGVGRRIDVMGWPVYLVEVTPGEGTINLSYSLKTESRL